MKYRALIILCPFVSLSCVHAELHQQNHPSMWQKIASLFYTEDNDLKDTLSIALKADTVNHDIKKKIQPKKPIVTTIQGTYYLSSIIFINKGNWAFWLNEQIITPSQMHQLLHISIKNVSADKIECQMNHQKKNFILRPHQTLNLSNGNIVNGDQRKSLLISSEDDDFLFTELP